AEAQPAQPSQPERVAALGAGSDGDDGARQPAPRPSAEPSPSRVHAGESEGGPATGQRRRPVVFDEDDDLDVPDFLK
ncbi:cell division protein FtsZ, partial [Actinomadura yumaensis]